ncbi:LysR family transcriptional regulator [Macrococcoides goetzii]|nr:LysR family transcriptional regulator [Macrococcus goetzii]TDM42138.1 LysR family transcriptional regulator [Macrococcus goetzii]TDM47914.1 LysR family transcriptional regulator [Macrococcus goetzii]TDM50993.1 LysR family transcriptional regulator [Macrococcus goetzii]
MDMRQIKYFIAVADTKNFSYAAKSLFITQPTLSQSIKKLEAELNSSLFNHNDKQFHLTKTGEILYNKGKKIVKDFDELIEELHQTQDKQKETIRVGLTALFAIQFMKEISTFIATHSNVDIHFTQGGSRKIQQMLAEGKIDVGLNSFPQIHDDIIMEPLNTTTHGYNVSVVMDQSHPLASRNTISFSDLKDGSFSTLTEDFMLGKLVTERSRSLGFEPNIVFINNDWEVLTHILTNLNSVSLLPTEYEHFSKLKSLVWIPLADKNNHYPIGISLKKNTICSESVNDFIKLIKSN